MEVIHWTDHDLNVGHRLKGPAVLCRGVSDTRYYMVMMVILWLLYG